MRRLLPLVLAAALAAPAAHAKDVLHLYNWNNYIAPETVKRFEASCNCELKQTYYSDNEEMLAKLAAGAKGYDIVVPTGNALESLIKQKKLRPIDKAKLPNLKNINAAYLDTAFDPKNQYSVPYAYTITMLGYNDEKIRELGIPMDTWAVIFDPKILEKIKGRVTVLDSSSELMAAALKYLGHSINETDEKKLKEAADLIKKAKPYWAAFNASSYIKELTVGNIWSRTATRTTSSRRTSTPRRPAASSASYTRCRRKARCWPSTAWPSSPTPRARTSPTSSSTSCSTARTRRSSPT